MFSLTRSRNMSAGKSLKLERFLAVLREHIICNVKWVEVRKMSNVFWAKLYCKISGLFASFCWLWDFLLENLKLKRNSDDVRGNFSTNIKKLYAQNNIFKKRIPNMTFWIIYILVQILGTALGRFSQFIFSFRRRPTMVADIFSQSPHHKKASYGPDSVFIGRLNTNVQKFF